ncbi:MAG: hypothetical protein RLZZ116_1456 [Planctomycetota bacterium]
MGRANRATEIGVPHHIAHRGNHRRSIFDDGTDCQYYLALLHRFSRATGTRIAAFCIMPNHVHVIAVPSTLGGLSDCIGRTHRKYSEHLNRRLGLRGSNWEGRFYSSPMGPRHTFNALKYVERNPVDAGLVKSASEWKWSSAGAHCGSGKRSPLLNLDLRGEFADPFVWRKQLDIALDDDALEEIDWIAVAATVASASTY